MQEVLPPVHLKPAVSITHYGLIISDESWHKALSAYGDSVNKAFRKAKNILCDDPKYLADCIKY